MKYSLSFLAVFSATAHGIQSARSWVVNTHALEDCSDPTPVGYTGFDVTLMNNHIRPIQFPEGTRAIWFRDSDTAAHVLDLHDGHKGKFHEQPYHTPLTLTYQLTSNLVLPLCVFQLAE
jgi:hypothetical protein